MYCEVIGHPPAPLHEGQWPKWINHPSLSLSLCSAFLDRSVKKESKTASKKLHHSSGHTTPSAATTIKRDRQTDRQTGRETETQRDRDLPGESETERQRQRLPAREVSEKVRRWTNQAVYWQNSWKVRHRLLGLTCVYRLLGLIPGPAVGRSGSQWEPGFTSRSNRLILYISPSGTRSWTYHVWWVSAKQNKRLRSVSLHASRRVSSLGNPIARCTGMWPRRQRQRQRLSLELTL